MSNCPKNRTKWTGSDWELGWQLALRRINGIPAELARRPHIDKSLTTLDEAFIDGDSIGFQMALIVLMDYCAELVNRGDYEQWW
jgi:hypothetical protein